MAGDIHKVADGIDGAPGTFGAVGDRLAADITVVVGGVVVGGCFAYPE